MLSKIKKRLSYMMFNASTDFSELILGSVSLVTGIWLILPYCHWVFPSGLVISNIPEVWGIILVTAGLCKLVGVTFEIDRLRMFSAFIATLAWLFLTSSLFLVNNLDIHKFYMLSAPITLVLAFYNILIYIKLRMRHINAC